MPHKGKSIEVKLTCKLFLSEDYEPEGIDKIFEEVSWASALYKGLGPKLRKEMKITGGEAGNRKLSYIPPSPSPEEAQAIKDRKLGVKPLREAKCDSCKKHAYTRWYGSDSRGKDTVVATVCEKHNKAFISDNKKLQKQILG